MGWHTEGLFWFDVGAWRLCSESTDARILTIRKGEKRSTLILVSFRLFIPDGHRNIFMRMKPEYFLSTACWRSSGCSSRLRFRQTTEFCGNFADLAHGLCRVLTPYGAFSTSASSQLAADFRLKDWDISSVLLSLSVLLFSWKITRAWPIWRMDWYIWRDGQTVHENRIVSYTYC